MTYLICMEVRVSETMTGSVAILQVSGKLVNSTAATFEKSVLERVEKGIKGLIFDFSGMEFLSSMGIRSITSILKVARTFKIKVAVFGLQVQVAEVFDLSGMSDMMDIYPTQEEAFNAVKSVVEEVA